MLICPLYIVIRELLQLWYLLRGTQRFVRASDSVVFSGGTETALWRK